MTVFNYAIPMLVVYVTLVGLAGCGSNHNSNSEPVVLPDQRELAVDELYSILNSGDLHSSAESGRRLWELGYHQGVRDALLDNHNAIETSPEPILDNLSALALTQRHLNKPDTVWLDQIREVLLRGASSDQGHAVRALINVDYLLPQPTDEGYDEKSSERDRIEYLITNGSGPDKAAGWYLLLISGDAQAENNLVSMLASTDHATRAASARWLRRCDNITDASIDILVSAAKAEPIESPARVYLLSALFKHAQSYLAVDLARVHDDIIKYVRQGNVGQRLEACRVFADVGTGSDVKVLVELFTDKKIDATVRANAAYAVCRIERRDRDSLAGFDWGVITCYGLGMVAVGWFYSRKNQSTEDYLLGGRAMRSWAVGLSMFATLLSTISYLSYPGEAIRYGPMILSGIAVFPLIFLVVGYLLIPYIMRLKVTSAYEILETRLGLGIRLLGGAIFLSLRFLWMATIIYVTTSAVIVPLLGWDVSWTPWVCTALGIVTVIYTSMGGLRAVVLTDVVQTIILFGGAIITMVMITTRLGGPSVWWPNHWLEHWPDPVWGLDTGARISFVGMGIAMFTWYVCTSGSDQMAIQRYLSTRDAPAARRVLLIALTSDALVAIFLILVGLILLAFYTANPHTLPDGQSVITASDSLFTSYIAGELPVGIRGLVIAGLLAAAMSSLSSGVNSSSSVIAVDFIDRFRNDPGDEAKRLRFVKLLSVLVGAVAVGLSLYVALVPGNIVELAYRVVNLMVAPLFLLFFMAMFIPWATPAGAWAGAAMSTITAVLIAYWGPLSTISATGWLIELIQRSLGIESISFLWVMPASLVMGIVTASLVSALPNYKTRVNTASDT